MRHSGAGQRWNQLEGDVLRKHDLAQSKSVDAPLMQTFQPPGAGPVSINLTSLSSRPKLVGFWLTLSG